MRYLLFIPLLPVSIFSTAWLFMLTVGVIHGEWLPMMPTVSYWESVLIVLMLTAVLCVRSAFGAIAELIVGKNDK